MAESKLPAQGEGLEVDRRIKMTVPTKSFLLCLYGTSYLMIENCEGQRNPGPAEAPRLCLLGQMFGIATFPFPGAADLMAICPHRSFLHANLVPVCDCPSISAWTWARTTTHDDGG